MRIPEKQHVKQLFKQNKLGIKEIVKRRQWHRHLQHVETNRQTYHRNVNCGYLQMAMARFPAWRNVDIKNMSASLGHGNRVIFPVL